MQMATNRVVGLFGRDLQHGYGVGGEVLTEVRAKTLDSYGFWDRLDFSGCIGSGWVAGQKYGGAVGSNAIETRQREVYLLWFKSGVHDFDVERATLGVTRYTGV